MKLLDISHLNMECGDLRIVSDLSLSMEKREILGIVGESGSGKSTMLKSILRLSDSDVAPAGGEILYQGRNLLCLQEGELRALRGAKLCMIFQNPDTALDPLMRVREQFYECVRFHEKTAMGKKQALERSREKLALLHFEDPGSVLDAYPFELSGGMKQRTTIAMAMMNEPELILADEPTSALDVSVQSQVIRALLALRDNCGTAILLVTHNMNVVAEIADTVGVMYGGVLVEYGKRDEVLEAPAHPYSRALIDAMPKMDGTRPSGIGGTPPVLSKGRTGCPFYERCAQASKECGGMRLEKNYVTETHWSLCTKGCGR